MSRDRLLTIVLLAAAVLLHLGAHLGRAGGPSARSLPEDDPVLLANPALVGQDSSREADTESDEPSLPALLAAVSLRTDVAWSPGGVVVGRSRFRPLTTALFVVERRIGRSGTATLAGLVGLALHILTAFGAVALLRDLGGGRAGAWIAGLLVVAAPAGLVAAAWPARQGIALAAALGIGGVRLAVRPGVGRALAAGGVLALAFLAHEAAAGAFLAACVIVATESGTATWRARAVRIACAAVPVVAVVLWRAAQTSGRPDAVSRPDLFDGLVGVVLTLLAPLLPTRLHVAGGPWIATGLGRIAAGAVLAIACVMLIRRRRFAWAAACLAAVAAAAPVVQAARGGGAPFQLGYSYVVLPFLATAVGLGLAAAVRRGRAVRVATSAVGGLLVGACVATTLSAVPAFASRAALVDRALRDDPRSVVARAWALGVDVAQAGNDSTALLALSPRSVALAAELVDEDGEALPAALTLRPDGAAAMTVATVLAGHAHALTALPDSALPVGGPTLLVEIEPVAAAATLVAPDWEGGWSVLAMVRERIGRLGGALEAARRATELMPDNAPRAERVGRLALEFGRTDLAVAQMQRAASIETKEVARTGRPVRRDHVLLHAKALYADASTRNVLIEFEWAAQLVQPLYDDGGREPDLVATLKELYLLWGDALASEDRTAMARLAYLRAAELGGAGSDGAEHLRWLDERLRREMAEAEADLAQASRGEGNIANALLRVAIVLARSARWDEADAMFRRIEEGQGGMNPPLRMARAVHRYAARDDELDRAAEELRAVLAVAPELVEARFELGRVLARAGRLDEAAAAFRRAAVDGAAYEWGSEALANARVLEDLMLTQRR